MQKFRWMHSLSILSYEIQLKIKKIKLNFEKIAEEVKFSFVGNHQNGEKSIRKSRDSFGFLLDFAGFL